MKPVPHLITLLLALALTACERQKPAPSAQASSAPATQDELAFEELRKQTHDLYQRSDADPSVCLSPEWKQVMDAHGPAYKKQLIACIRDADSITITEHSDRMDFHQPPEPPPESPPFYEYQTVRLTDTDKAAFLVDVEKMDDRTISGSSRCIFEPHHRLIFERGKNATVMSICFKCSELTWPGSDFIYPMGLMPTLRAAVERSGLKPERDWPALAKAHGEKAAAAPPTPAPQPVPDAPTEAPSPAPAR